jgi:hypothetical protein
MKKKKGSILLKFTGFLTFLAPLVIVLGVNFHKYFQTVATRVSFSFGLIIIALLVICYSASKLKIPKALVGVGVAFVLSLLLKSILVDAPLILGTSLIGIAGAEIQFYFSRKIKEYNDKLIPYVAVQGEIK